VKYDLYPNPSYFMSGSLLTLQECGRTFRASHSNVYQNYNKRACDVLYYPCFGPGFLPHSQMSSTISSPIQLMLPLVVSSMPVPKLVCPSEFHEAVGPLVKREVPFVEFVPSQNFSLNAKQFIQSLRQWRLALWTLHKM
jgi:hypothetical protein